MTEYLLRLGGRISAVLKRRQTRMTIYLFWPCGSDANFLTCMFLSGEKALQILSRQNRGPNFQSGGCFFRLVV
jgi:hypothetical protein